MSRPLESTTLGQLVERAADALGAREALVFGDRRYTYERVRTDVRAAARGLLTLGIEPGEHVMMLMPNSVEWIHVFFAIAKLGAVAVPINTRFRTVDLEYVLRQSDATTLFVVREFAGVDYLAMTRELVPEIGGTSKPIESARFPKLRRVVVIGDEAPAGAFSWSALVRNGAGVDEDLLSQREARVDPRAPALMLYTSGTTGTPKGALHSHAWIRTVADAANRLGFTSRDAILLFIPLFHSMGLYLGAVLFLLSGARLVLMERFDPGSALELVERERASLLFGFDTHYFDMLEHSDLGNRDLSSLRLAFVPAGMAGVEPVARRVNQDMCRSFSGYGSSECGTAISLSFLGATESERLRGSGFPMPGYEFQTRDPVTGVPTPPDVPGELWIRGYGVMLGYYGKPAETAAALDSGRWFRTGDMALIDREGFLRFMGRFKEMLKVGGENVDPTEVEAFLEAHPDIAQVKLIGVPDPRIGESPVACIIPRPGKEVTLEGLRAFCAGKIASFKTPRRVVLVTEFPMTSTGKVQRNVLRDRVISGP